MCFRGQPNFNVFITTTFVDFGKKELLRTIISILIPQYIIACLSQDNWICLLVNSVTMQLELNACRMEKRLQ